MANSFDKWAEDIFKNAQNKAQEKGFSALDDTGVNESIVKNREEEIAGLKESIEELKGVLKRQQDDTKKKLLERDMVERPREIKDLQVSKTRLETALNHLRNKLEMKQIELEEKEKKFTKLLKEKLDEKARDFKKWQELENSNLAEKIRAQAEEIENFKLQVKQWQSEAKRKEDELSKSLDVLEKERAHWMKIVKEKEDEIRGLQDSISQKEDVVDKKRKEVLDLEFQMAQKMGEAKEKELQLVAEREKLEKEIEFLNKFYDEEKGTIIKAGMIKREARLNAEQYKKEEELKLVKQQIEYIKRKMVDEKIALEQKLKNREEEIKRLHTEIEMKEKKLSFVEETLDREMHIRRSREEEKLVAKSQIILGEAELRAKYVSRQQDLIAIKVALERERAELKRRMEEERDYWQKRVGHLSSDESDMKKRLAETQKRSEEVERKLIEYEKELVLEKERHKSWEDLKESELRAEFQKKMQLLEQQEKKWEEERIEALTQEIESENKDLENETSK